jgi:eukaryotic-like serine/threonine-protein kinase
LRERVRAAQRLGNYTLAEKLGEGGMGEVYLAHHALLKRPTAIKLLPPERLGERAIARFEREVRELSRLCHPNTVAIYDFGRTPEGIFYYAMEYLEGLNLEELVELDGPQPPERVIHVLGPGGPCARRGPPRRA